jgi:tetratricopeptide (TPR) repeat protein
MRQVFYILTILTFISCGETKKKEEANQIDKRAIELNDKGIELAMTFDNDSIKKAIELFDQATKIEPDYYLAYWNKLVFQNHLGQKTEAFKTINKLENIRPNNPDLKVTKGVLIELNGDSLSARQKFLQADKIYTSILDTLTNKTDPQKMTLMNKAVNLKFLGREDEGNKILEDIKTETKEENLKEMFETLIRMTRKELIDNFKPTK